jgi:hypothetical protein
MSILLLGAGHYVEMGRVASVSEDHTASIIRDEDMLVSSWFKYR